MKVVAFFVAVQNSGVTQRLRSRWGIAILRELAACSLGIYLLHPLLLSGVGHYIPVFTVDPSALWVLAETVAAFALSAAVVFVLRRVPVLREFV